MDKLARELNWGEYRLSSFRSQRLGQEHSSEQSVSSRRPLEAHAAMGPGHQPGGHGPLAVQCALVRRGDDVVSLTYRMRSHKI
jgi:hypothetical protein